MRKINKHSPPKSFITYINTTNPDDPNYKPTFEGMDSKVRKDLQNALLDEQGWICGYCQQSINENIIKIEHHCEQSICNGIDGKPDRTLDYSNLMAVCLGKGSFRQLHCDSSKATDSVRSLLPIELSPWNQSHIDKIIYTSTGQIKSINQKHNKEIDEVLNLNTKLLKDLRAKKFGTFFKHSFSKDKKKGKLKLQRLLEDDISIGNKRFPNSFPGMSEYMLAKYCS